MSMHGEHERKNGRSRETGPEQAPGMGAEDADDRAAGRERRMASSERRVHEEAAGEVREAKERIADALWEKPAAFAEYASGHGLGPRLSRFLDAFAALDDETLATDALKRAREAAAKAPREGEAA